MTEVNVVFPETGPPIVVREDEALCEGQKVFWHIRSDNNKIKHVKVYFKSATYDKFFPENDEEPPHQRTAELKPRGGRMRADIYGTAPPMSVNRRKHKYTVEGLDGKGKPFEPPILLDPQIYSVKP